MVLPVFSRIRGFQIVGGLFKVSNVKCKRSRSTGPKHRYRRSGKDIPIQDDLKKLLGETEGQSLPDQAVSIARWLLARALKLQSREEKRQQNELNRMIQSPSDKVTLISLTDQAFRSHVPHRAVDQLIHILDVQGIARFFTPLDRTLLKGFQSFGSYLIVAASDWLENKIELATQAKLF